MKSVPLYLLPLAITVLPGCVRSSLTLEREAEKIAPVIGANAEEFRLVTRVTFAQVPEGVEEVESTQIGFVALSGNEVVVAKGKPGALHKDSMIRVAINDLEGMASVGPYLQLKHQGKLTLLLPFIWFTDTADMGKLYELESLLDLDGVPAIEAIPIVGFIKQVFYAEYPKGPSGIYYRGQYWQSEFPGPNGSSPFYNGNEPIDSHAFTPMEDWGAPTSISPRLESAVESAARLNGSN